MINSTSSATLINNITDGLRHRRKTDQPITQITNTEKKIETGPFYECYLKMSDKESAGFSAFGFGVGTAAATIAGASLPLIVGAGIGYGAIVTAWAKAGTESDLKCELRNKSMSNEVKSLKLKLE